MRSHKQKLGQRGEDLAAKYLKSLGFKILERNMRTPFGEIDLIAKDKLTLVFIEVKSRTGNGYGWAEEAVGFQKQKRLSRLASWYLMRHNTDMPVRFDVLAVEFTSDKPNMRLIQNAFDAVLYH